jgi:hypothetical protein
VTLRVIEECARDIGQRARPMTARMTHRAWSMTPHTTNSYAHVPMTASKSNSGFLRKSIVSHEDLFVEAKDCFATKAGDYKANVMFLNMAFLFHHLIRP